MVRIRPVQTVVGLAAAGLIASAGPALAAVNPPAPSLWSATSTTASQLLDAASLGTAPASTPVPVSVGLHPRDLSGLDSLIAAQSDPASASYHHFLTPTQFADRFGATTAQIGAVTRYLRSQGLSGISVSANRLEVRAQGTAASTSRAFHTHLGVFRQAGVAVVANTAAALVPSALGGLVDGVVGLDRAATVHTLASRPDAISSTSYNPPQLATAYDATSLPTASATSVAVMAEGNLSGVVTDLRTEEAKNGLPQVPVTIVRTGASSTDTSGTDEWDLDSQTSTAMAGDVKMLYLYDAPSLSDADIVTEIEAFVSQDRAPAGSASFGECDSQAQSDGTTTAVDTALEEARAQGQTFFASSGDTGSSCSAGLAGLLPGPTETSYPASGTYTTGVGGTTLTTKGGAYSGERAWTDGGGGLSSEPQPSWAAHADSSVTGSASSGSGGGCILICGLLAQVGSLGSTPSASTASRGVPDIAMDADPNTGANIVVNGTVETVGGTSLSSPLALGAWARIDGAHGNSLGDAGPLLYGLYNKANPAGTSGHATPGLHDVTSGSNGAYSAKAGYDLVTGLGSIDVAALNKVI